MGLNSEVIPTAVVVERAAGFTTARLLLDPPPEKDGVAITVRYNSVQAPDEQSGQRVGVHLSMRRSTRQDWSDAGAPPALEGVEWDESTRTLMREGRASFATARGWLAGVPGPVERGVVYGIYERSNELYGTDPASITRLEALVGRDLAGTARLTNKDGAEVTLAGEEHLYGWLWNSQVDWYEETAAGATPKGTRVTVSSLMTLLPLPTYQPPALGQLPTLDSNFSTNEVINPDDDFATASCQ